MESTNWIGRPKALLAVLLVAAGLVAASPVAAYPTTPEGEPLQVGQTIPLPDAAAPHDGAHSAATTRRTRSGVGATEPLSAVGETNWAGVALAAGIAVAAGMTGMALISVGPRFISRRRSARAH